MWSKVAAPPPHQSRSRRTPGTPLFGSCPAPPFPVPYSGWRASAILRIFPLPRPCSVIAQWRSIGILDRMITRGFSWGLKVLLLVLLLPLILLMLLLRLPPKKKKNATTSAGKKGEKKNFYYFYYCCWRYYGWMSLTKTSTSSATLILLVSTTAAAKLVPLLLP